MLPFRLRLVASIALAFGAHVSSAHAQTTPREKGDGRETPDFDEEGEASPPSSSDDPRTLPSESPAPDAGAASDANATPAPARVTPLGYVEAHYAYNFNRPSNGITNFRGFDNRHNSFTLSNAALGADFASGSVGGRLILQIGSTPSTYYSSEPVRPGARGANASGAEVWKYLQEAFVSYKAPVGRGLYLQLGLCASPIGFEVFAVKDNWNWSRSNLFFGLPFYHTGLRATYAWTHELSTTLSAFNGWNSVVDNNEEKSIQANVTYKSADTLMLQLLYFGGVERPTSSPEGPYWRHHFDGVGQYRATPWLSFAGQVDYGWEPNRFGTSRWFAGALYTRIKPVEDVYIASTLR